MSSHFSLKQGIYPHHKAEINVEVFHENDLTPGAFKAFTDSIDSDVVGVYATYGSKAILSKLSFASLSRVLIISLKPGVTSVKAGLATRQRLHQNIFDSTIAKYGFSLDKLLYSLFHDLKMRATSAFEISEGRLSLEDFLDCLGGQHLVDKEAVASLFRAIDKKEIAVEDVAKHAWVAAASTILPKAQDLRSKTVFLSTKHLNRQHLEATSKLHRHQTLLRNLIPDVVKNEIKGDVVFKKGQLSVVSSRFKSRIRPKQNDQYLRLDMQQGKHLIKVTAETKIVNGRSVLIAPKGKVPRNGKLVGVTTMGKDAPSNIEQQRSAIFCLILQQKITILANPFVQTIWFPRESVGQWHLPAQTNLDKQASLPPFKYPPNDSQVKAIHRILSPADKDRVVLIHGPPGTGKTTVIAAATQSLTSTYPSATVWLVAHSNVAVKNIAEKLIDLDFDAFRLIVSKDFHYEWHEHLYGKVERNMIRTDSLPQTRIEAERMVLGARVVLCTLTTLLNHQISFITGVVPVKALVVDEASQIEIGDYIPVIFRYHNSLSKLVFIGDHKQLAPYGYEDIKQLESIFEKKHLQKDAIMLDTQYRMPINIGEFISTNVYEGRLKSHHNLNSWKTCRFVNVKGSKEERRGHSWVNIIEMKSVIAVARLLHFHGLPFKIITPYDPQRSLLENELQSAKLPFEDKCFNVDSFQGNEEDYIIISLVRSDKIGFLREDRRVNVMLTRCKKGMIICTNRHFVHDVAKGSLVGKLARKSGEKAWIESPQVLNRKKMNPFA